MDRLYIGNDNTGRLRALSLSPIASRKLAITTTDGSKVTDILPNQSAILNGVEVQIVANPPWPFNPVK